MLKLLDSYIDSVVHLEIIDGFHLVPVFGLYCMIVRDHHPYIIIVLAESLRQGAYDICKSAGLDERHAFRCHKQYFLHKFTFLLICITC